MCEKETGKPPINDIVFPEAMLPDNDNFYLHHSTLLSVARRGTGVWLNMH